MLDARAITRVCVLAIRERDAICAALQADERSPGTQKSIADWNSGRTEGFFPAGETTQLLARLRPQYGYSDFRTSYQQANADAIKSGLGSYLLPKLEAVCNAHMALLAEAQDAYERSSTQLMALEDHLRAVSALIDVIRLHSPDTIIKAAQGDDEAEAESDDALPKSKRADSPSRIKARSAYDYAMERIPNANAMTAPELFDAIKKDGEAAAMLPPTAESFTKYLNDCGIRLKKGGPKAAGGSVVRRSDL